MAFFKKKIEIAAAMRLALRSQFRRDLGEALKEVAAGTSLSTDESQLLEKEVELLEISMWLLRFGEAAQSQHVQIDQHELGLLFGIALKVALRDTGSSEQEAEARGDELAKGMVEYLESANEDTESLERAGPFFAVCRLLPERTFPNPDFNRDEDLDRQDEIFYIAKQANEHQAQVMASLLKEYRLINS